MSNLHANVKYRRFTQSGEDDFVAAQVSTYMNPCISLQIFDDASCKEVGFVWLLGFYSH